MFYDRLFRQPETFVSYALIAVSLQKIGYLPSQDLETFQVLIDRANILFSERPAHRQLEIRHIFDAASFRYRFPSYNALYLASSASKPLNPFYITDSDVYAITHSLFYCTDFGARSALGMSPRQARRAYQSVKALLGMSVVRGNWDLVSELLICCYCLQQTSSTLYQLAWSELLQAQWDSGVLPGPYYDSQKERQLPDAEKPGYVFQQCYHSTLVAALAGVLCPWNEGEHEF